MCRWLAYFGDPIYLDRLLYEPKNSLIRQSLESSRGAVVTNGDGFGIGWYASRETPGVYRDILPAWSDSNLRSLTHQLQSRLFFAHVRAATGTATSRENCHPFHSGRWMFMHNGAIGGFAQIRRQLEALITDDLYAQRRGNTDSEVFFLLLLANGIDEDVCRAFEITVEQIEGIMRDEGIEEPFKMTAALSDGDAVYALRHASAGEPPSLYWRPSEDHLIIVSEPLDDAPDYWHPVQADSILVSAGHGETAVHPFEPRN